MRIRKQMLGKKFIWNPKWLLCALVFLQTFFAKCEIYAQAANISADEPDPNFHIYLAIGQSNMEGQAEIEEEDLSCDPDYLVMCTADHYSYEGQVRELGKWYTATPPLAHTKGAKMGMADYFGRTLLEEKKKVNSNAKVGVIVVAVSGTSIQLFDEDTREDYLQSGKNPVDESWFKNRVNEYGGDPYQRLIETARLAQKDGVIKGIIMHQGEADKNDEKWPERVKKIYDNILRDLELGEDIPLLAGEVLWGGEHQEANQNISKLPQMDERFYVVSSEGFTEWLDDGHSTHFTSQEYRDFGRRYARKMLEVETPQPLIDPAALSKVSDCLKELYENDWYMAVIQGILCHRTCY